MTRQLAFPTVLGGAVGIACAAIACANILGDFTVTGGAQADGPLDTTGDEMPVPDTVSPDAEAAAASGDSSLGDSVGRDGDGATDATVGDVAGDARVPDGAGGDAARDSSTDGPAACGPTDLSCDGSCVPNDPNNCGSCGNACTTLPNVSAARLGCDAGRCLYSCASGYADCSDSGAGCATALSGGSNCGACGNVCSGSTPVCGPTMSGGFSCASGCPSGSPTRCGSTCVDTTSDTNNCGACGHGCLGGVCGASACQPVVLAASSSLSRYSTLEVNASGVYWTTQGTSSGSGTLYVSPLPSAGSTYPLSSKTLATGLSIYQIALDALNVYWGDPYATSPSLMKIPASGGYPPATIAMGGNVAFPTGVAVDSANIYAANEINILQGPLGGSSATNIAPASQAYVIAADGLNLYWTDFGASTVVELPKGSAQTVTLATGQSVGSFYGGSSLVVDSANVYWLNSDGSVRAVPKSAGATPPSTILVTSGANGIAVDGTNLYFTNVAAGTVMKTPTIGGAAATLASTQAPFGAIAVDSNAVYWAGASGLIAVAK